MFLAILSWIRSRKHLGGSEDGNEWIYVDAYFRSRSSMCERIKMPKRGGELGFSKNLSNL